MNIVSLNVQREALRKELTRLDAIKPGCGNCNHYQLERCDVYGEVPPGDWFKGPIDCPEWQFDALPF